MDGFSYNNIFDTKGIEYIIVIFFLILLIPFWFVLNRKKRDYVSVKELKKLIPQGIFLSGNHMWAYLEKNGQVLTGMDDFILRATGKLELRMLRKEGDLIRKGEVLAEVVSDGRKLKISAPVSGSIASVNNDLENILEDPYDAWICRLVPSAWKTETKSFFIADESREWLNHEVQRFRDFVTGFSSNDADKMPVTVLQDGGEITGNPLSELPAEAWADFEKTFLTLKA